MQQQSRGDEDALGKDGSERMGTATSVPHNMSSAGKQPGHCEV